MSGQGCRAHPGLTRSEYPPPPLSSGLWGSQEKAVGAEALQPGHLLPFPPRPSQGFPALPGPAATTPRASCHPPTPRPAAPPPSQLLPPSPPPGANRANSQPVQEALVAVRKPQGPALAAGRRTPPSSAALAGSLHEGKTLPFSFRCMFLCGNGGGECGAGLAGTHTPAPRFPSGLASGPVYPRLPGSRSAPEPAIQTHLPQEELRPSLSCESESQTGKRQEAGQRAEAPCAQRWALPASVLREQPGVSGCLVQVSADVGSAALRAFRSTF